MPPWPYREVWCVDFEFTAPDGERPRPLCLVARELRSGRLVRQWLTDRPGPRPPYPTGPDCLFVAYFASAELGCHLALNWPMPARVLDLYAEFRQLVSGLPNPHGFGVLGCLAFFGLDGLAATEKEAMRQLAMRGGGYTLEERQALTDYCQTDVDALARLLPRMAARIDLPRALLRGRYMAAVARMESAGVPVDRPFLERLQASWDRIKGRLVAEVNRHYGVFVPTSDRPDGPMRFSLMAFAGWLARAGLAWPRLPTGELATDDDTFREMARVHPREVGPLRGALHVHRGEMKRIGVTVGRDGRARCLLSPFASKTGRNQPSNSRFVFGPAAWLRSLIRPEPGRALAYVDWSAQELGIAACLSGDAAMQAAYASGDPYLWWAKRVGAVPADATKRTHGPVRDQFKTVMLGTLYGLSAAGIARRLDLSPAHGRELLQLHREAFRRFWQWSELVQAHGTLTGRLTTSYGWQLHVTADTRPTTLANWPMQATGAEMMRLAACLSTERGLTVCCPIHDAFLVEGPADRIADEAGAMQGAMREASELVLPGFPLRTDCKVIRHPDRYRDDRGRELWELVCRLLEEPDAPGWRGGDLSHGCDTPCRTAATPVPLIPSSSS